MKQRIRPHRPIAVFSQLKPEDKESRDMLCMFVGWFQVQDFHHKPSGVVVNLRESGDAQDPTRRAPVQDGASISSNQQGRSRDDPIVLSDGMDPRLNAAEHLGYAAPRNPHQSASASTQDYETPARSDQRSRAIDTIVSQQVGSLAVQEPGLNTAGLFTDGYAFGNWRQTEKTDTRGTPARSDQMSGAGDTRKGKQVDSLALHTQVPAATGGENFNNIVSGNSNTAEAANTQEQETFVSSGQMGRPKSSRELQQLGPQTTHKQTPAKRKALDLDPDGQQQVGRKSLREEIISEWDIGEDWLFNEDGSDSALLKWLGEGGLDNWEFGKGTASKQQQHGPSAARHIGAENNEHNSDREAARPSPTTGRNPQPSGPTSIRIYAVLNMVRCARQEDVPEPLVPGRGQLAGLTKLCM